MKNKLKVVFVLIAAALAGIIGFQIYWSISAYKVNKERFDANINIAMQRAMNDCKKDYFDSIRRVLVRRLSPPETIIKIDTLHEKDIINVQLQIYLSNKFSSLGTPYQVTTPVLDFYRRKITHKATLPEVLTEMSFYEPSLMNAFTAQLGMYDIMSHSAELNHFSAKHKDAPVDSIIRFNQSISHSIYELPPNYQEANTNRIRGYLKMELYRMGINSSFGLLTSVQGIPHFKSNMHYSETAIYACKYQGFTLFGIVGPVFYIRAVFHQPQYAVLKNMVLSITLSVLLLLFVVFCFYYILRTIMAQKKLAALKDDFINNMTHELKTPIATITVAIEGLQKFNVLNDAEKTRRYLETSRTELIRLNELVTKVLDVAAYDKKEIDLEKENINVNDLFAEVIASEKQKASKPVNISFANNSDIMEIYADRLHFRNVLTNLIDNGIKYSHEHVEINISCVNEAGSLTISIKDNGIGIPSSQLGLIFEKFHRVATGNVHAVKGTGLGLSYVKYIVGAHGGTITVKSEINKGSEFFVSIPLKNG